MMLYFHIEEMVELGVKGENQLSWQLASPIVPCRALCEHSAQHSAITRRQALAVQQVMAQARHRETTSQATFNNLTDLDIVALLQRVRLYGVKVRDTLMQCQPLPFPAMLAPPPGLPPATEANRPESTQYSRVPSLATRRAACTHLTMERLYGPHECNICYCPSKFGWVYSCTQDDELATISAVIPTFEPLSLSHSQVSGHYASTSDMTETPGPKSKLVQTPTPQLSSWIEKAIKEGHYTSEQIEILRAQKQKVVDTALAAVERFDISQAKYCNPEGKNDNAMQCVDPDSHLPGPPTDEVQSSSTTDVSISVTEPNFRMFPYCKYRACQLCRPTFRDRTWQCFDEIFASETSINLNEIEAQGRILADLAIMRHIGLRQPPPRRRPKLRAVDSREIYTITKATPNVIGNDSYRKKPNVSDSADVADEKVDAETKGVRESWKRAFKSMLTNPRGSIGSNLRRMGKSGGESIGADVDASEATGTLKHVDDDILAQASDVPLPTNDGIEKLAEDVEEADIGGIAITENAAETGTANVIMSI